MPEIPVKSRADSKPALCRYHRHRLVCLLQILAGRLYSDHIDILQRTHIHIRGKHSPELRLTDMRPLCNITYFECFSVVFTDIVYNTQKEVIGF